MSCEFSTEKGLGAEAEGVFGKENAHNIHYMVVKTHNEYCEPSECDSDESFAEDKVEDDQTEIGCEVVKQDHAEEKSPVKEEKNSNEGEREEN